MKRMMDVLCEHCGKGIPGDSKFCRYCGQPVIPQPPQVKTSKIPLILVVLLVCVVLVLGIRQTMSTSKVESTTIAAEVDPPALSEYETKMPELKRSVAYFAREMVNAQLSRPQKLRVTHDWDALTNRGVFVTHSGTVEYLNSNNMEIKQPYKVTMVLKEDYSSAFDMALVIGDTVFYDNCYRLDETGKIIAANTTYEEKGYGEQVFDHMANPDLWDRGLSAAADAANAGIQKDLTLADYQAIDIGMTYDQVCKVLGGTGVETSRAGSGQNEVLSVIWSGPDAFDPSISIVFVGGKVSSKAQLGLQ